MNKSQNGPPYGWWLTDPEWWPDTATQHTAASARDTAGSAQQITALSRWSELVRQMLVREENDEYAPRDECMCIHTTRLYEPGGGIYPL